MPVGISDLPNELLVMIFSFLSFYDIVKNVKAVCTHWRNLGDRKCLWNTRGLLKWVNEAKDEQGYIQRVRGIARHIDELKYSEINEEEPDEYLASNIEKLYLKRFCEPSPFHKYFTYYEYNGPLLFLRKDILCPNLKAISSVDSNISPTSFRKLLEKYPQVTTIVWARSLFSELCAYLPSIRQLPKIENVTVLECHDTDDFPEIDISNINYNRQNRNGYLQDLVKTHPELEFLHVSLRSTSGRTIKTIFETCQNLRVLKISTFKTDELEITSTLPNLEELFLNNFDRNPREMKNLFVAACKSPKLKRISLLNSMNVTEEMYNYISKECPLLEQFAVAKRNFDDTEMDLSFFLKHWKNTFINNKALEYMSNCRNLQDLCICYSDKSAVTDEGILALSRGCIQLKKVDFEGCLGITDYGIMELSRHCHGLCFVNLCNCYHITGFGFYCLVINCPRLQEVQMHSYPFVKEILRNDDSFPEVSISSLFENVPAVGTKCDCFEIYNSWESWDSYSESKCCPIVIQGQNEIKVLYGLTDEMIRQCSRSNQYEETQTGFQLTDLEDRDLSKDPTAVHHLQAPFDCSRIQKLDLSNCRRICDSDVLRICKHFPEIRNLNLAHNFKLSDTSVTAVSRQLTLLKVLDLKGIENLTNASLNYLLERSLEFFSFSPYSQVSVTGLRNFLVCSKNLKEIKLNFKVDISAKLTPDIIRSMLSEEDCGFFMTLGELSSYVIIASRCSKYD